MLSKSTDWFLYDGDIGRWKVEEKSSQISYQLSYISARTFEFKLFLGLRWSFYHELVDLFILG